MTVNPDVGLSAPDTLHPEGLYAFRLDLNGDAREEVTFKFRFGEPRHGDGSEHAHTQPYVVRKATGDEALRGDAGESLLEGETGSVATGSGLRAYVGIAPELFAANAGFRTLMTSFYKDQRFDGDALLHQQDPFARRNVTAIVLEVPSELIGKGKINAWVTISLFGHAPEVQVSRWGLPMVTHIFLNDPSDQEVKEQFNASVPSEDLERFAKPIADVAEKMTTYAGSAADPGEYGKLIAARLCPDTLPYELGTSAAFEVAMLDYKKLVQSFKHCPLKHPVILLIDNDDGANQIFSVAAELGIKGITHTSTANFYRLTHNLYLVKTPETKPKACIEDLFDPTLLMVEVKGKKFDPDKKQNEAGKYGKVVFAEQVVRPGAPTIDFNGFTSLLDRIVSVVDDYAKSAS